MPQNIKYTVRADSNLKETFRADEVAALSLEKSIDGISSGLRDFAMASGVGLGLHALVDFGKEAVQGAADYEVSMIRIKNASLSVSEGVKNQLYISNEVDKFKTDLQRSADAYGSFLLKIKNSGLDGDAQRHLYDNIMTISKVSALPQGEIDATVRNVGIMLGEGILEARHLRQLSYVHPQIVPFLAEALGLKNNQKDDFAKILGNEKDTDDSAQQKLSLLMSGGKLTKMSINSNILVDAIEKYKKSVEGGLPEATNSIQSQLNDLDNSWLRFKNDLVYDNLDELKELFHTLEGGVKWLEDHKSGIENLGESILFIGGAWLTWKTILVATDGILKLIGLSTAKQTTETVTQTAATVELNTQLALLNENLLLIIANSTEAATSMGLLSEAEIAGFGGAAGFTSRNLPINPVNIAEGEAVLGAGIGGVVSGVFIVGMAVELLEKLTNNGTGDDWKTILASIGTSIRNLTHGRNRGSEDGSFGAIDSASVAHNIIKDSTIATLSDDQKSALQAQNNNTTSTSYTGLIPKLQFDEKGDLKEPVKQDGKKSKTPPAHHLPPEDVARGQRITTYNIKIGDVIGQKNGVLNVKGADNEEIKRATDNVTRSIINAINAAQEHDGE